MFKSNPVLDSGALWEFNQMQQGEQLLYEAKLQL